MSTWVKYAWWVGLLTVAAVVPAVVATGNLPDPIATHWGGDGQPNGSLTLLAFVLLPLGIMVVGVVLGFLFRSHGEPTPEAAAITGLMGGVAIAVTNITVILNWNVEDWTEAGSFGWLDLVVVAVAGLGLGWLGYLLGQKWFPVPPRPPVEISEHAPIAESVVWSKTMTVRWVAVILGPLAIVFVFLPGWLKLISVLYVVLIFAFSKIGVTVDASGLSVALAGLFVVKRVRIDDIESAIAIDLEPREWAGWGYRVIPSGSAIVLRKGPAIQINRVGGKRFAVTIDDAETGAAILAGHLARVRA